MNPYVRQEDIKGQVTKLVSPISVLKNTNDLENLARDLPYSFLCKKAEKLATATYLVTGFLSDSEPLKWQIRECALGILSDVASVANPPMSEMAHRIKSLSAGIGRITSLFEIASAAGFVSGMNLAIFKEEYRALAEIVESQKIGNPEGGYVFSREFFESREPEPNVPLMSEKEMLRADDLHKGHSKKDTEIIPRERKESPPEKSEEKHFTPMPQNNLSDNFAKNVPLKKAEKSSRRDVILGLIKDKGDRAEVSIKDVVGHFSDCGEKTIQRELTALVEEGVLKKIGERRWSRYSLNTQ
jgi:hypothetical protein